MHVKCHECKMATYGKCYSTRVTWNLHMKCIFTREVHIYKQSETWFTQTQDVNSISLCHVSLRVHAYSFEVIIEQYLIAKCNYLTSGLFLKILTQLRHRSDATSHSRVLYVRVECKVTRGEYSRTLVKCNTYS